MNIKIFLVAVVVVALGSGIFFWQLGRTSDPLISGPAPATPAEDLEATPASDRPVSGRGSLGALLALARALECTVVNDVDPQFASEGTVFLSDGKIRGDFLTGPRDAQVLSSLIIRDNTMYLWSTIDGETWGMKNTLSGATPDATAPKLETQEPIGLEDEVRYDCKPWVSVDGSVFVPPGDVLFRDMSTIMEQGMEYGTTFEGGEAVSGAAAPGGGDACAACALVTDASSREVCEIQFSCGLQPN
jgi:hypothetical protein